MENIIDVQGLKKTFTVHQREGEGFTAALKSLFKRNMKEITAVDNISFSIRKGDIHALIGPNGAGKSTTIKILSGVLFPTAGHVRVMGFTPWEDREKYVRNIGVHFGQKTQLTWELPAVDTFAMHRTLFRIPRKKYEENTGYLVNLFNCREIVNKPVRNLSLGERMKCELICTLIHDPELVFLDEPTIGIDFISRSTIREFIKKVNREKNVTFILTTHDLNEIENLCRMVTIINHGKIVFSDSVERLKTYFSNKKIIDIKFTRDLTESEIDSFGIVMNAPLSGKMEFDISENDFREQIYRILSSLPVMDLNINTVDIESVINAIYQTRVPQPDRGKTN